MSIRTKQRERYREWLNTQDLQYGFPSELSAYSDRGKAGVMNSIPPVELWDAIVPTIRLLEQVRERFGLTTITSAYRSRAYNAAVYFPRVATDSQHSKNCAVDFQCATGTPAAWHAFLADLRDGGAFKGGLGLYNTFVHVDTRGVNANWRG